MNDDNENKTTNQPVTLKNEATPDAAFFAAAIVISPYAHLLSSGLKLDTELFSKKYINKMADNNKISATSDPDAPDADNPNSLSQDSGSTDSNSPYSLINRKFAPYSTNTIKNQRKEENKIDDKVTIGTTPFPKATGTDTPNVFAQYDGSTDSYLPYSLINHKFASHSTNIMKN